MKERSVSTGQGRKRVPPQSRNLEEGNSAVNPFGESLDVYDSQAARDGRKSYIEGLNTNA